MSKEASSLKVGGFVLAILFLGIGMILFFGTTTLFTRTDSYILYFEDSVKGLSLGSAVKFKGVPIGQVKKIYINYNQPATSARIPVLIAVDAQLLKQLSDLHGVSQDKAIETEVNKGLRAQLQVESFITGLLFIELDYFPESGSPTYVQKQDIHKEIPTIKGPFSELDTSANNLLARIAAVDYEGLADEIKGLAANMSHLIESAQVERLGQSLNSTMESLSTILERAKENDMGAKLTASLANFNRLSQQLEGALAGETAMGVTLHETLDELAGAAESLARLADYLERNPNALLTGKQDE